MQQARPAVGDADGVVLLQDGGDGLVVLGAERLADRGVAVGREHLQARGVLRGEGADVGVPLDLVAVVEQVADGEPVLLGPPEQHRRARIGGDAGGPLTSKGGMRKTSHPGCRGGEPQELVVGQASLHQGRPAARTFAEESLAVLLVALIAFLVAGEALTPWILDLIAPGFRAEPKKFELAVVALKPEEPQSFGALTVTPYPVVHGSSGGPFLAYRIEAEGRVIAYSADTEWTETLVPLARDADLFIAEAYTYDRIVKNHLSLTTLETHLAEIAPRRLILTHMSDDMLSRLDGLAYAAAHDGMTVDV